MTTTNVEQADGAVPTVLDHVTTVRSRELGQTLHRALRESGRNGNEIAALLAWSPSKVSRLLSGKRLASSEDIAAFLALCRVVGRQRDEILTLASSAYESTWWQDHGARLPIDRVTLADNETLATTITSYHDTLIPDLLQTPEYTQALLHAAPTIPRPEIDARVTAMARRQLVLDQPDPPRLQAFLDAHVLTRHGAGDAVMGDQIAHLLRMAARPNIGVRVVPEGGGVWQINAFTLLQFADVPAVVYLEFPTSAAFMEHDDTITSYQRVLTALDQRALDETSTRSWLVDIADRRARRDSPSI